MSFAKNCDSIGSSWFIKRRVTIGEQLLYETTASDTAEVELLDARLARAPGIPSSHACSEAGIGHRATHPLLTHTTLQVACSPSSKGGSR